jgi:hypothetical protein
MQLQVIKKDGTAEQYMHTKVLGTFNNVLDAVGKTNIIAAEQFAEAVTFHLYHNNESSNIKSEDICELVIMVLNETGYCDAAETLAEYRRYRTLQRARIEIVSRNYDGSILVTVWNKSDVVKTLVNQYHLEYLLARVVASAVEEKVFNLNMRRIDEKLLEHLLIAETEMVIEAEKELSMC